MQDGFFFFLIFKQKIRYRTVIKIAKRVERDKLYQQKVNGHAEIFSKQIEHLRTSFEGKPTLLLSHPTVPDPDALFRFNYRTIFPPRFLLSLLIIVSRKKKKETMIPLKQKTTHCTNVSTHLSLFNNPNREIQLFHNLSTL